MKFELITNETKEWGSADNMIFEATNLKEANEQAVIYIEGKNFEFAFLRNLGTKRGAGTGMLHLVK